MTIEELDIELASWQKTIAAIVNNVYGLYELPAYRKLAGDVISQPVEVTGETRRRAAPCIPAVKDLLSLALELDGVMKRANELRTNMPFLFQEKRILEIHQLLTGPCIRMAAVQTPLSQRGLFSVPDPDREFTPRQVIDAMSPAFESAKAALLELEEAWNKLPVTLDGWTRELQAVVQSAAQARVPCEAEAAAVRREIDEASALLNSDPLGAQQYAVQIETALQRLKSKIENAGCERRAAEAELVALGSEMAAIADAAEQLSTITAERRLKIAPGQAVEAEKFPPETAETKANALAEWRSRIETAIHRGEWSSARIGMEKWRAAARDANSYCKAGIEENRRLLSMRTELRGRLDALKAKCLVTGLGEDLELSALERSALNLLSQRPAQLSHLEQIISEYQRLLTAKTSMEGRNR